MRASCHVWSPITCTEYSVPSMVADHQHGHAGEESGVSCIMVHKNCGQPLKHYRVAVGKKWIV